MNSFTKTNLKKNKYLLLWDFKGETVSPTPRRVSWGGGLPPGATKGAPKIRKREGKEERKKRRKRKGKGKRKEGEKREKINREVLT